MRYPEECPVFEVTIDGTHIRAGAIVEGLGPATHRAWGRGGKLGPEYQYFLSVRVLDGNDWQCFDEHYAEKCRELAGFLGCCVGYSDLKPLTRAAREMLELVK